MGSCEIWLLIWFPFYLQLICSLNSAVCAGRNCAAEKREGRKQRRKPHVPAW